VLQRLGQKDEYDLPVWLPEMHIDCLQVSDMRSVTSQSVFDNNDLQFRMKGTNTFKPAFRGISFAIVLSFSVLFDDRFDRNWNDLSCFRMSQEGSFKENIAKAAMRVSTIGYITEAALLLSYARHGRELALKQANV